MPSAVKALAQGGIGVLPTDTIYGVVGKALDKRTVSRLYRVRKRNPQKPFIILIAAISDLKKFGIALDFTMLKLLHSLWPGPVSVIIPCTAQKFSYLHRGTRSLAFRLPRKVTLRRLLKKTGPLVAPSANPEGFAPAKTLAGARKYFGNQVDFYISGRVNNKPSTLVKIVNGKVVVLRQGLARIKV